MKIHISKMPEHFISSGNRMSRTFLTGICRHPKIYSNSFVVRLAQLKILDLFFRKTKFDRENI